MKDLLVYWTTLFLFAFAFHKCMKQLLNELAFYRNLKWDFSKDSRFSGSVKHGDVYAKDEGPPLSNKARVVLFLPLATAMSAFAVIFSLTMIVMGIVG
jgi:hypothetical protein